LPALILLPLSGKGVGSFTGLGDRDEEIAMLYERV
jgi:hypothetical protein